MTALARVGTATIHAVVTKPARAFAYLVSSLAVGTAGAAWVLVATLGVGVLAVTQAGGWVFLGAAWLTRRLADLERRRVGWVRPQGRIPSPYQPDPGGPLRDRVSAVAAQPATWRDLAWLVLLFPLGLAGGIAAIVATAVTLGAVTAPAWGWAVPNPRAPFPVDPLLTTGTGRVVLTGLGLAAVPLLAWLLRMLGRGQAALAATLLAPGEHVRLVEQAAHLAETRARVVDAQAAELRRIERDLHDGAQARIVAAGMTLALAARKLRAGGSAVSDVDLARQQLDAALAELRRLVRGIHPPILTDRGLAAALAALAADSPLTVEVRGVLERRLPAAVESAAYFVVAEGLANAGKHAEATTCTVELSTGARTVQVCLTDDGRGGADPAGGGLDGLRRRVEALDGVLTVDSPPGGPTILRAELPCVS